MISMIVLGLLTVSPIEASPAATSRECAANSGWAIATLEDLPRDVRSWAPARVTIDYDINADGRVANAEIVHRYGRPETVEFIADRFTQSVFQAVSPDAQATINCRVRLEFAGRGSRQVATDGEDVGSSQSHQRQRRDTWYRENGSFARNARTQDRQ